jgi:hypothetical protein
MTVREALTLAYVEAGMSRQEAEFRLRMSDGVFPEVVQYTYSPVKPGHERELIEQLKRIHRMMDANPQAVQSVLDREMAKRTKLN